MQVQLTFRHMNPIEEIERQVFKEADRLDRLCPQLLTWCHVVIEKPHLHRQHGEPYSVRVAVQGTAGFFVASSAHGDAAWREKLPVAVSEAFGALRSQLQTRAEVKERSASRADRRLHRSIGI